MKNNKMDYGTLTPNNFTNKELASSVLFYADCRKNGFEPVVTDFQDHFRCSRKRADILRIAAAWAYKVKQKEKAQLEAKRKKAC